MSLERIFRVRNGNGEIYELNELANFFHDPQGLGYSSEASYVRTGNKFTCKNYQIAQGRPEGYIRFGQPEAYKQYFTFCKFLQVTPLTLIYNSFGTDFLMDVDIDQVDKGELSDVGLDIKISFNSKSLYYKSVVEENIHPQATGKIYPYTYSYTYSKTIPGTVIIESDSADESPCKIQIYGKAVNPHWYHYSNGVLVAEGILNATIATGNKLVVDSSKTPYIIQEQDSYGNIVNNLYQKSDFSTERFIFLRKGTNRISCGQSGSETLKLSVEGYITYEGV